jgi:hypothetical protein
MAESQEKDVPRERDLPMIHELPRIEDLPKIEDLPELELPGAGKSGRPLPIVGDPRPPSDPEGTGPSADQSDPAEPVGSGEPPDVGLPHEPGAEEASLQDEIFAMASTVQVGDDSRPEPLLRLWQGPVSAPSRVDVGRAAAGFLTFAFVDAVMMYAPLMTSDRPSLLPQMVALLLLAFGLGGLLAWKVRGAWRPFGLGMMLGWVFLTLVSLGLLTGVSP